MHVLLFSLLTLGAIVLTVYVAALIYLFLYQERFLFPGMISQTTPNDWGGDAEDVTVQAGSFSIHSLLFKPSPAGAPPPGVILYFHGNRGDLTFQWAAIARDLMLKTGWMVWVMDYPGYGKSTGHFVREKQLYTIGPVFVAEIRKRFGTGLPIISYGRSIGSGFATRLAVMEKVDGLVLETPTSTCGDWRAKSFVGFPSGYCTTASKRTNTFCGCHVRFSSFTERVMKRFPTRMVQRSRSSFPRPIF